MSNQNQLKVFFKLKSNRVNFGELDHIICTYDDYLTFISVFYMYMTVFQTKQKKQDSIENSHARTYSHTHKQHTHTQTTHTQTTHTHTDRHRHTRTHTHTLYIYIYIHQKDTESLTPSLSWPIQHTHTRTLSYA